MAKARQKTYLKPQSEWYGKTIQVSFCDDNGNIDTVVGRCASVSEQENRMKVIDQLTGKEFEFDNQSWVNFVCVEGGPTIPMSTDKPNPAIFISKQEELQPGAKVNEEHAKTPGPKGIQITDMRVGEGDKKFGHAIAIPEATPDPITKAPHYNATQIEPITVIEAWNLGFNLGNTIKYIARAEHKGASLEDLKKARAYLTREITKREGNPRWKG